MLRTTPRKAAVVGLAALTLTGGFGAFAANAAPAPSGVAITGLSVVKGSSTATTSTLITGTGFLTLAEPNVMFGENEAANLIVLSDTQIAAVAPALAAEAPAGKVDVKLADGEVTYDALGGLPAAAAKDDFTYLVPFNATIATGSLMSSVGGSKLTVTSSAPIGVCGADFTASKVTATVANVLAPVTCSATDASTVTLTVPAGVPSNTGSKVVLFHDGVPGAASSAARYAAVVTGIDKPVGPTAGSGTATVAVTGKGFSNASAWKFGTQNATCTPTTVPAEADTKVNCVVPAVGEGGGPGAVSVSFTSSSAPYGVTSKATYTYSDLG